MGSADKVLVVVLAPKQKLCPIVHIYYIGTYVVINDRNSQLMGIS